MLWILVLASLLAVCRANEFVDDLEVHTSKVLKLTCEKPRPRAVNVTDLLSPYLTLGKIYYPSLTVLNLCDASCGYCPDPGSYCGPLHVTYTKLPFSVTFVDNVGEHKASDKVAQYLEVIQHTACECKQRARVETQFQQTGLEDRFDDSTTINNTTSVVSHEKVGVRKGSSKNVTVQKPVVPTTNPRTSPQTPISQPLLNKTEPTTTESEHGGGDFMG